MSALVRRVGAVVTLSIVVFASAATFASAPRAVAGTDTGGVDLVAQDAWTPIGGTLDLQVLVPASLATQNATLSLAAYQPVTTRSAFERVVDSGPSGSVLDQVIVPLALLPASPTGTRALSVGIESSGGPRAADQLSLRRPGVYPLLVEVRDGDDRVQGGFTTFVVAVETDSSGQPVPLPERLGVAWVWPLAAAPSTLPDGQVDPEVLDQLQPDGRLGRQAVALTRAGDVPLTLVPGPETLDAWARAGATDPSIARGEAALLDAASREQVVPTTYVPSNLPSLLAAGLGSVVDAQLVRGDETLARLLGTRPDVRTALARPVDAASLARLRARGVDRVIVDSTALAESDGPNPTRPFSLQPPPSLIPSGPVTAIASDASIARFLDGPSSAALRAQRLFAGLSVIALETPALVRAVTIVNPDDFDPDSQLLDAILTGLRGHPWLVPMTVDEVFESVPQETTSNGTPVTRALAPYTPPPPPVPAVTYVATQQRLDAFRSLVGATDPQVVEAEHALLISESSAFTGPQGALRARSTLQHVRTSVDDFLSLIRVPQPSTITLTSRSGEIPITFRNETGRPIDVTLQLNSEKLTFPEGTTRTLRLPTRSTTLQVPVEARTSGTFPLQLTVTSADGALTVANRTFRVRSTAFSTVGVVLMAGAAVFLAGWWGVHIRKNRRHRSTPRAATPADERPT